MASIHREVLLEAPAEVVWAALAAVGEAHRVFSPVLSASVLDAPDLRIARFASGMVVKERIIDVDPRRMRVAYAVVDGDFAHHSASMQVVAVDAKTSRFLWTTDVLPHEAAKQILPLVEAGTLAMKQNLECREPAL
jgi:hypothetical protein